MGKSSQRKGRSAELELCRILQEAGYPVRPGAAESYGQEPDILGLPGVHIECKRHEKLELYSWLSQAERDSERFRDGLPAVFHRGNRKPWVVTMELSDFLVLYSGRHGSG